MCQVGESNKLYDSIQENLSPVFKERIEHS
jgi:hypothetical protein